MGKDLLMNGKSNWNVIVAIILLVCDISTGITNKYYWCKHDYTPSVIYHGKP